MRKLLLLILIFIVQTVMPQENTLSYKLYKQHDNYVESSLKTRRFKHSDVVPLIKNLRQHAIYTVEERGKSVEDRSIFLIKFGTGEKKVFLWSQMHGDEPTATSAAFDMLNFFTAEDEFTEVKNKILKELTIYYMPMVNPDGAELFQRRNLMDIDLNRDAKNLVTPEANILMDAFREIEPEFGFNLHDQSTLYSAGHTNKQATISFLAPAFNVKKDVNDVRKEAMRLIGLLYEDLSEIMPGHIGRYDDEYEKRAFGDTFVEMGTSVVLVESGGWKGDAEKQYIRKINFVIMVTALNYIAERSYEDVPLDIYNNIPYNSRDLFDLMLRNLYIERNNKSVEVDIGINLEEENINENRDYYTEGYIRDIGDLSTKYGLDEFDAEGMKAVPGKIYPKEFTSFDEVKELDFNELYSKGYTFVKMSDDVPEKNWTDLPINIIENGNISKIDTVSIDKSANFLLKKDDEFKYVILNGYLQKIGDDSSAVRNGIIINGREK